jgi:hypothetical protein
MNTVDVDRVNDRWDEVEKEEGVGDVSETIEFDKKNFYILDAQRLFKKDC